MIKSRRDLILLNMYFKTTASFLNFTDSMKSYWNLKMQHNPYVIIWAATNLALRAQQTRDEWSLRLDDKRLRWLVWQRGKKKNLVGLCAPACAFFPFLCFQFRPFFASFLYACSFFPYFINLENGPPVAP